MNEAKRAALKQFFVLILISSASLLIVSEAVWVHAAGLAVVLDRYAKSGCHLQVACPSQTFLETSFSMTIGEATALWIAGTVATLLLFCTNHVFRLLQQFIDRRALLSEGDIALSHLASRQIVSTAMRFLLLTLFLAPIVVWDSAALDGTSGTTVSELAQQEATLVAVQSAPSIAAIPILGLIFTAIMEFFAAVSFHFFFALTAIMALVVEAAHRKMSIAWQILCDGPGAAAGDVNPDGRS